MRGLAGTLLVVAALLKAVQVYLYPADALSSSELDGDVGRLLLPFQIGGEFGLGLAAILGLYWKHLRRVILAVFAALTSYSALLIMQGEQTCGCFGQLEVDPRWTFAIDAILFSGLFSEYLLTRRSTGNLAVRERSSSRSLASVVVTLSVLITLGLTWHLRLQSISPDGDLKIAAGLTILEPEDWVGRIFPLQEYIDIDVSQGGWLVLITRHNCVKCQEAIPKYEELAVHSSYSQIAVISVPPHDRSEDALLAHCRAGRLRDNREWFVETPVEIRLLDGVVVSASKDLPTLDELTYGSGSARTAESQAAVPAGSLTKSNEAVFPR